MAGLLRKIFGGGGGPATGKLLEVGDEAPDFRVQAHDGRSVSLADYRGRKVVLWFYPKADTPGCTIEGKGFCADHAKLEALGVAVLGVSFDDEAANKAFAAKFAFPYPLLCDTGRRIGVAYGACSDASAKHAARISYLIGEDGKVLAVFPKVEPKSHPGEILALVR